MGTVSFGYAPNYELDICSFIAFYDGRKIFIRWIALSCTAAPFAQLDPQQQT